MEPATFQELKAGLPEASNDFICEQMAGGASLVQAQAVWKATEPLRKQLADQKAELDKATAKAADAEKAALAKAGTAPDLSGGGSGSNAGASSDPIAAYSEKVRTVAAQYAADGTAAYVAHEKAKSTVAREYPALLAAYLEATNSGSSGKMALEQRNEFAGKFQDYQQKARAAG